MGFVRYTGGGSGGGKHFSLPGCMDPVAFNYNPSAVVVDPDNACVYDLTVGRLLSETKYVYGNREEGETEEAFIARVEASVPPFTGEYVNGTGSGSYEYAYEPGILIIYRSRYKIRVPKSMAQAPGFQSGFTLYWIERGFNLLTGAIEFDNPKTYQVSKADLASASGVYFETPLFSIEPDVSQNFITISVLGDYSIPATAP